MAPERVSADFRLRSMQPLKVLVAEDSADLARLCKLQLESFGCEVLGPVPSVAGALRLLASGNGVVASLDVALLDLMLSDGDAGPVAQELERRSLPFVLVTGFEEESMLPVSLRSAPRLTKPYTDGQLRDILFSVFASRT